MLLRNLLIGSAILGGAWYAYSNADRSTKKKFVNFFKGLVNYVPASVKRYIPGL